MKASRAVWNPVEQELYAANPDSVDELRRIAGTVTEFDIVAGDDVRVLATEGRVEVEPLNEYPLLLRDVGDGTVRAWTQFEPDSEVEIGGIKRGEPMAFADPDY